MNWIPRHSDQPRNGLPAGRRTAKHSASPVRSDEVNLNENPAFNVPAKLGHVVLFVFLWGAVIGVVLEVIREDAHWKREISSVLIGMLMLLGPILAAVAWATRRYFRNKPIGTHHKH